MITAENAIDSRYTTLAETACCLSCGGAINHAKAQLGEVAVDLGSGRGNDVIRLAEQVGESGYVYGIDISEGMIEKAKKNIEKFGIENAEILFSSIENLPLESDSADLFISNCVINHAKDKKAVWSEVYRVLRSGGRFVVSDIYASAPVPEEYANDPEAVAECWAGSIVKDQYIDTLIACGFKELTIIEESDFYPKGKISVASFTIRGAKQ